MRLPGPFFVTFGGRRRPRRGTSAWLILAVILLALASIRFWQVTVTVLILAVLALGAVKLFRPARADSEVAPDVAAPTATVAAPAPTESEDERRGRVLSDQRKRAALARRELQEDRQH